MVHEKIGPYRIIRLLGSGGMGHVYEALQEPIERRVALKVLRPEFASDGEILERFFNEARVVNRIEHPSLVQVTDFGHTGSGVTYIAMEFLRGETLEQRLRTRLAGGYRMPIPQVLSLAWQVADAVAAAHEKGIIHRDLKPDNLMLCPDPMAPAGERVRILDFGIAKLLEPGHSSQTKTQALMGTPRYMSPEQCRGAGQVDTQTDVYSLGVIVYQLLAGVPPFVAEGVGEIIAMQLLSEPAPLSPLAPQASADLCELVHLLLRKDRSTRPTMAEARDALAHQRASFALRSAPSTLTKGHSEAPLVSHSASESVDGMHSIETPTVADVPWAAASSLASRLPSTEATDAAQTTLGSVAGEPTTRRRRMALLSLGSAALAVAVLWSVSSRRATPQPDPQSAESTALIQTHTVNPGIRQQDGRSVPTEPEPPTRSADPMVHAGPKGAVAPSVTNAQPTAAPEGASPFPAEAPTPTPRPEQPVAARPSREAKPDSAPAVLQQRMGHDKPPALPTETQPAKRPIRRALHAKRPAAASTPSSAPKVDYVD